MDLREIRESFTPLPEIPSGSESRDTAPHYPETSMTRSQRWQLNVDNLRGRLVDGPSISQAKILRRYEALDFLIQKMRRHGVPVLDTSLSS